MAVTRVHALAGDVARIPDGPVPIPAFIGLDLEHDKLDGEVVAIIEHAIGEAAAADSLGAALEIGYAAFGATACTQAARERIGAFVSGG